MATQQPEADVVLATLTRTETDRLVLSVRSYEGKRYVDVRMQFRADDGEWRFTKKGCTVRRGELKEIGDALKRAGEMLGGGADGRS